MSSTRKTLLEWAEQGRIERNHLPQALLLAGAIPSADDWRRFLDRLLLWLGTILVAAGIIFFLAYNWYDMGRFAKFGLAEALVAAVLAMIWRYDLEGAAGKAGLLAVSLFTGALLALIGQTYQTGADSFELFGAWAALILPWALAGRFAALWMLWLVLVNLAVSLYYQTFGGFFRSVLFDLASGPEQLLWILFIFNTAALALWEGLSASGITWLRERWATRLLATAGGGLITLLAIYAITDNRDGNGAAIPCWFAWLAGAYAAYRHWKLDAYVLAGGVLSFIIVTSLFLGKHMLNSNSGAGAFLFIGITVIALAAAGGWWLKRALGAERT